MSGATFQAARATVGEVESFVTSKLSELGAIAESNANAATSTAATLAALTFEGPSAPPEAPEMEFTVDPFELASIEATTFGEVSTEIPDLPNPSSIDAPPIADVPTFTGTVAFSAPPLVAMASYTAPEAPTVEAVELPDPLETPEMPEPPELLPITIPDFEMPDTGYFLAELPTIVEVPFDTAFNWADPTYVTEIMEDVLEVVRRMFSGTDTGLPAEVEQALWERAASREDLALARQIADVATEFSSRGFTMPPGMQAARVDALREDGIVKKLAASREFAIESARIAAEQVLYNMFENAVKRTFEAARFGLEAQQALYNGRVALFNAKMNGYNIQAQVYKIQVDVLLSQIQAYRAQIDGLVAKGTLNEQQVRVYNAQLEGIKSTVDLYRARMEAAKIQADIERTRIDTYKAEVDAFTALIGSEKVKVDAYTAQVQAEAAKGGFAETEARVYASLVQGHTANAELQLKATQVQIETQRANAETYRAQVEGLTARVNAEKAVIEAGAQAFIADTQRFTAENTALSDQAKLGLAAQETQLRTNLARYAAQIELYTAQANKATQEAGLRLEGIKAAASISSTLSAGAMAALNVGATISGSANIGATGSVALSQSASEQYQYNVSSTQTDAGLPLSSANLANQDW